MVRLLHLSDIHLNAGYSNKNEIIRNKLKMAMKSTITKAFDFAIENEVDGLIIAGDFFDHDKVSFEDESFVTEKFNAVLSAGISIFYCSGNHDPMYTAHFLKTFLCHDHFHLYEDDQVKCDICVSRDSTPYKVWSVGHKSKNEQRNLIRTFPQKDDHTIWVGIAHASVPSALTTTDKTSYMATALSDIEKLNYDYFGLGHIHIRQLLTAKIGYSGNIQGLNIKENGLKGGFLITITSGGTTVEPIDFSEVVWEQVNLEIPWEVQNLSQLQEWMIESVMPIITQIPLPAKNIIVRVVLKGKTILRNELKTAENIIYLTEYLKNRTGLLEVEIKLDGVSNLVDSKTFMKENTLLSDILHTITKQTFEDELLDRLLSLPIYNKQNTKESKVEYLKKLTLGLDDEIINRMVVEKNEN